jgi:hypothetical protein
MSSSRNSLFQGVAHPRHFFIIFAAAQRSLKRSAVRLKFKSDTVTVTVASPISSQPASQILSDISTTPSKGARHRHRLSTKSAFHHMLGVFRPHPQFKEPAPNSRLRLSFTKGAH